MGFLSDLKRKLPKKKKSVRPIRSPQFDDDDVPMWYDRGKATLRDKILLDRRLRFFVVMFVAAVVVPVIVYIYIYERMESGNAQLQTCLVKDEYRVPCFPGYNVSEEICNRAACCFNETTLECHHMLPSSYGFTIHDWENISASVLSHALTSQLILSPLRSATSFGSQSTSTTQIALDLVDESYLIISFANSNVELNSNRTNKDLTSSHFNVTIYGPQLFLDVYRRLPDNSSINPLIFTTSRGPIISSEDYSEVTLEFSPKGMIYGLGGMNPQAKKGTPRTFYNRPTQTGSHPVLIAVDEFGYFHGIFIDNSSPMEIEVYEKSNLVILRFLTSVRYDIHLFAGPTVREVMNQLTKVLGKPKLPPYWALGFHVCPNLDDDSVCTQLRTFMNKSLEYGIPWDSHCLDDSMIVNRLLFGTGKACESDPTVWKEDELVDRHLLLTLPVPVPLNNTVAGGAFLVSNGADYVGEYKLQSVHYPDFSAESSGQWLGNLIASLTTDIPSSITGGYVLLNNWPEEDYIERPKENLDYLPKALNGSLSNNTVWWQAQHIGNISHISLHNVYGLQHVQRLASVVPANNIILSTASYPGLGAVGGCHAHPTVDIEASWTALQEAYDNMFGLGLSGIALAGSPVCGNNPSFDNEADEDVCIRWYQLAALSPFMRVSSGSKFRDPISLSDFAISRLKRAIELRYRILPYLYSVFEETSRTGMPVVRPMSFEFPQDNGTWNLHNQYMLGSSLLVAPVLKPDIISLSVYLPKGNGTWYFLEGGHYVNNGTGGYTVKLSVSPVQGILLLRPGSAVLMHEGGLSTSRALVGNYSLAVGLHCDQDSRNCTAQGSVILPNIPRTDFTISSNNSSLSITNMGQLLNNVALESIRVFGLNLSHSELSLTVTIAALPDCPNLATIDAQYEMDSKVMDVSGIDLSACTNSKENLVLTW